MRKVLGFLLLLSAVCLIKVAPAFAGSGSAVFEMVPSTTNTPILVTTGGGTLFDVNVATAAVGDWAVCYDSASVTGYTFSGAAIPPDGSSGSPKIGEVVAIAASGTTSLPQHIPPINFTNGLVCGQKASNRMKVYYRTGS